MSSVIVRHSGCFCASLAVFLVGGCYAPPAPVVDMAGVDPAQYNRDLAACMKDMPFVAAGNYKATCMAKKGYKILASD